MAVVGCRWTTPCSALLDADICCVMLKVQKSVECNCGKCAAETKIYASSDKTQTTVLQFTLIQYTAILKRKY
jgi:hypothetical protein